MIVSRNLKMFNKHKVYKFKKFGLTSQQHAINYIKKVKANNPEKFETCLYETKQLDNGLWSVSLYIETFPSGKIR